MSATHRVQVVGVKGKVAKLRIEIIHDDENGIPVFRTALVSMLSESILAAEDAGGKVSAAAKKLFTDEPEDDDEAATILARVEGVVVESGTVAAQHPKQGVRFARQANTPCTLMVELTATKASLFAHLATGLSWETAPLYPELEEAWPSGED